MPLIPATDYHDPQRVVWTPPNVELIVARYYRDQLGTGANVVLSIASGETYAKPVVRVNRTGGVMTRPMVDEPTVDLDVWARDDTVAGDLTRQASGLVFGLRGVVHLGAVIARSWFVAGMIRRPEEANTGLAHFGFTAGLRLHPAT